MDAGAGHTTAVSVHCHNTELHGNGDSGNTAVIRTNVTVIPRGWFDFPAVQSICVQ